MYYLKTQNGLKAQIAIACDKGFAATLKYLPTDGSIVNGI